MTARSALRRMAVAYPSGNTTAMVYDQLLPTDPALLNESIMRAWRTASPDHPEVEQCCFVVPSDNPAAIARVQMLGGEFCGNATRSAAWLVTGGKDYSGVIEVSGAARPLEFRIEQGEVTAEMPLPDGEPPTAVAEGTLVRLEGITQIVITDARLRQAMTSRRMLESLIAANKYDLAGRPAVGVSYYDKETSRADFCVWVNRVGTTFDETACGSGSCAIGVAAAMEAGERPVRIPVIQPSGEIINSEAAWDSARSTVNSAISGRVRILYDGVIAVPEAGHPAGAVDVQIMSGDQPPGIGEFAQDSFRARDAVGAWTSW